MDKELLLRPVTLPPVELMRSGFDAISQANANTEIQKRILGPLLALARTPIAIGSLLGVLGTLFEQYEQYLLGISTHALSSFRIMSDDLAEAILKVLVTDEALCEWIINEFIAQDLERTAADDADHACIHR